MEGVPVEACVQEPKLLGIADFEPDTIHRMTRLGRRHIRRGGIDTVTRLDGATATTAAVNAPVPESDVNDGVAVANSGEFHEERGECSAPPAHEALVRVGC